MVVKVVVAVAFLLLKLVVEAALGTVVVTVYGQRMK